VPGVRCVDLCGRLGRALAAAAERAAAPRAPPTFASQTALLRPTGTICQGYRSDGVSTKSALYLDGQVKPRLIRMAWTIHGESRSAEKL
jgi:hypothetical protein